MTKELLIAIAALIPLAAQTPLTGNAFQQSGWLENKSITAYREKLEGQSGPILASPVSATEVRRSEQVLSDGSHINKSETELFYRDSMGRMLTKTSNGAVLFDPVAGFWYNFAIGGKKYTKNAISEDSTVTIAAAAHRTSITSFTGQARYRGAKSQEGVTAVTEELQSQVLNGIPVKGSRVTITIPSGAIGNDHDLKVVNERWYSDDLKLLVKTSNSDPRFGVSTYELTNISQAPPEAALFQIPPDYTEESHH